MINVSLKVVLGMLFLNLSGVDVDFLGWKLYQRIYTTEKAISTTKYIKLVSKKEFAATVLDPEYKTFIVYVMSLSLVTSLNSSPLDVYLFHRSQIDGLIAKKALTKVSNKYINLQTYFFLT